jgi:hypothetical protein
MVHGTSYAGMIIDSLSSLYIQFNFKIPEARSERIAFDPTMSKKKMGTLLASSRLMYQVDSVLKAPDIYPASQFKSMFEARSKHIHRYLRLKQR